MASASLREPNATAVPGAFGAPFAARGALGLMLLSLPFRSGGSKAVRPGGGTVPPGESGGAAGWEGHPALRRGEELEPKARLPTSGRRARLGATRTPSRSPSRRRSAVSSRARRQDPSRSCHRPPATGPRGRIRYPMRHGPGRPSRSSTFQNSRRTPAPGRSDVCRRLATLPCLGAERPSAAKPALAAPASRSGSEPSASSWKPVSTMAASSADAVVAGALSTYVHRGGGEASGV